jgi:putative ABC transport system substrate-binding protein
MSDRRRREFLTLLGGAAAWPLTARAQQREPMRRVGVLMTLSADDVIGQTRVTALLQRLQQAGWEVGRNLRIELRSSGANPEDIRKQAGELVALAPDVIVANGSAAAGPLLEATRSVPIVFAIVPDPVGAGYVDSLARPGGNATGFTSFEYGIGGK